MSRLNLRYIGYYRPLPVPVPAPGMPSPDVLPAPRVPLSLPGPTGLPLAFPPAPLVPLPASGSDSLARPVPLLFWWLFCCDPVVTPEVGGEFCALAGALNALHISKPAAMTAALIDKVFLISSISLVFRMFAAFVNVRSQGCVPGC